MSTKGSFKKWGKQVATLVDQAVRESNHAIADKARSLAPTETGALRNAIEEKKLGDCRYATTVDIEYSLNVEAGTEDTPAQPFLRPAFDMLEDAARRRIEKAIRRA